MHSNKNEILSYCLNYYNSYKQQNKCDNTEYAASVLLKNQKDWRLQYFSAGNYTNGGRPGAWVSPYKARFTGTAGYVVFTDENNGKQYLLLTLQERVVNRETTIVAEPPIGYFNGEYPSSCTPHIVAECSEREIDIQIKKGQKKVNHELVYNKYRSLYKDGKLSSEPYQIDNNSFDTVNREVLEETGFNILEWSKEQGNNIIDEWKVIDLIDNPTVLMLIMKIHITSKNIPKLNWRQDKNEVLSAHWIALDEINIDNENITFLDNGIKRTIMLKPNDKVAETIKHLFKNKGNRVEKPIKSPRLY